MSVQAISWVLDHAKTDSSGDRLVLLSIANHADKLGRGAFPKVAYIAQEANLSERQVVRALKRLEDAELISPDVWPGDRTEPAANRRPKCWKLAMFRGDIVSPPGVTSETSRGDIHEVSGVTSAPRNKEEPSLEPSLTKVFPIFWQFYPRKTEKRSAEKALAAALKRASFDEILDGVVRYRNDPRRKPEFTKHPATWLNADCWLDEPETAGPPQREPDYHVAADPDADELERFTAAVRSMPWVGAGNA